MEVVSGVARMMCMKNSESQAKSWQGLEIERSVDAVSDVVEQVHDWWHCKTEKAGTGIPIHGCPRRLGGWYGMRTGRWISI